MGIQQKPDKDTRAEMLEEFKVLRSELQGHQQSRLAILGFTLGAVGTTGAIAIVQSKPAESAQHLQAQLTISCSALFFAYLIIIIALLMTSGLTQSIDHLGNYIRTRLEPHLEGLNWETEWSHRRAVRKPNGRSKLFGVSKAFALSYGMLILGLSVIIVSLILGMSIGNVPLALWMCLAPFGGAVFLCLDLWFRWRRSWESTWTSESKPI
ncbi:MAG: hypothetical protein KF784_07410 [Fimbriimonadaceae bacterium]|nr:hypothetical protein [Fimbriimonadaceae bacterium]